jgi:23S rRNA pseudouridine1911/1915/1917 synthase
LASLRFRASEADAGRRLDAIVAALPEVGARSAAERLVTGGAVLVDGRTRPKSHRLEGGEEIEVELPGAPELTPVELDLPIVHEDEHLLVVDKPAGLVVHPGAGNPDGTLVNGLLARYPELAGVGEPHRPGIVHRLDAGSSGLLVVARTDQAAESLIAQFASHTAQRVYKALVWGHPDAPHGVIDAPIGRSRSDPLRMAIVADGRPSRTEYRVLERFDVPAELALLECRLETGRTHQIRVHLSSINHPLVGDPVYGQRRPRLQVSRPFLHAAELAFEHPATNQLVTFRSPLAADLAALARREGG